MLIILFIFNVENQQGVLLVALV